VLTFLSSSRSRGQLRLLLSQFGEIVELLPVRDATNGEFKVSRRAKCNCMPLLQLSSSRRFRVLSNPFAPVSQMTLAQGHCYVEYNDPTSTEHALIGLNEIEIGPARLSVKRSIVAPTVRVPARARVCVCTLCSLAFCLKISWCPDPTSRLWRPSVCRRRQRCFCS
jgi:hypothetical protein